MHSAAKLVFRKARLLRLYVIKGLYNIVRNEDCIYSMHLCYFLNKQIGICKCCGTTVFFIVRNWEVGAYVMEDFSWAKFVLLENLYNFLCISFCKKLLLHYLKHKTSD